MNEEEFKRSVSEKLIFYRKHSGYTQAEIASKINYSDKSVSKWERAEGMPDICVLRKIGEVCGFTLCDFFGDTDIQKIKKEQKKKHIIVPLLSVGILWLVVALTCFILQVAGISEICRPVLITALPVMFIIFIVFSAMWWPLYICGLSVSGFIWSCVIAIRLLFPSVDLLFFIIVAAVFQVMVVLWILLRTKRNKK